MRNLDLKVLIIATLILVLGNVGLVFGQTYPGDCDGLNPATPNAADITYLVDYLFIGGPPPVNPLDCDCDAYPGVNYADLVQLVFYIYVGGTLHSSPGTDFPMPSPVTLNFNTPIPPGSTTPTAVPIYVDVPTYLTVEAFMLPFSYAAIGSQATATCTSIDFTGSVSPVALMSSIDPTNEVFSIYVSSIYPGAALPAGTKGLLCTAYFTTSPTGTYNSIKLGTAQNGKLWPMLVAKTMYDYLNGTRILIPCCYGVPYGDANCDGTVNVSDAVWIINYVFVGGAAPGDC
jgi:hypothetical protein